MLQMPALVDAANSMCLRFKTTLWNDHATHLVRHCFPYRIHHTHHQLSLNEHEAPELVAHDAVRGSETLNATLRTNRRTLQLTGRVPSSTPTNTAHALAVQGTGSLLATQHRAAERLTLHVPSRKPVLLVAAAGPHVLQGRGDVLRVGSADAASTWYFDHHGDDVYTLWHTARDDDGGPARCDMHQWQHTCIFLLQHVMSCRTNSMLAQWLPNVSNRAVMVCDDGSVALTANPAMLLPNTPCLLRLQLTSVALPPVHDPSMAVANPVAVGFALQTVRCVDGCC